MQITLCSKIKSADLIFFTFSIRVVCEICTGIVEGYDVTLTVMTLCEGSYYSERTRSLKHDRTIADVEGTEYDLLGCQAV
jgi:hypothetical protein